MLAELAKLRETQNEMDGRAKTFEAIFKATKEYQEYQHACNEKNVVVSEIANLENDIRQVAIEDYNSRENPTKDYGGVQIKIFTTLDYNEQDAVRYCLDHQHANLLKLNKSGFEKVAKELRPDFVTIKEEPRAQIAGDISEYLDILAR